MAGAGQVQEYISTRNTGHYI